MPSLNVGDNVRIVNVRNCDFGFNPSMLKLIDKTAVIIGRELSFGSMRRMYRISADNGRYAWSYNCFEKLVRKIIMKNE